MGARATRPKGIDEAIRKGAAGEGVPTIQGGQLNPYSLDDKAHHWAWQGAYEARQLLADINVTGDA